jgi:molybdopterin-guanine dinucleotide biosynthesis protein B
MKAIALVGDSETGKTRLIARLVSELKKRKLAVAVVKHCSHGFEAGGPGKDSSKFLDAGADGVALAAPGRIAIFESRECQDDLGALARARFDGADIVLIEGGKSDPRLRKIEVLRRGVSESIQCPTAELAALVADFPVEAEVPVFDPGDVEGIAGFISRDEPKTST